MEKKLFAKLVASMEEHNDIANGKKAPSREFHIDAMRVKEIREGSGLSQAKFAKIINVQISTLQNWEQGRRNPTGPARVLLYAIGRDPKNVLKAINS